MITRILIVVGLVLSCSLCIAEDIPIDVNPRMYPHELKSLTVDHAAKLVAAARERLSPCLSLVRLTSIDKDVAKELAKFDRRLDLRGLTSIDKEVAKELAKFEGEELVLRTSIDKDVAKELANFEGGWLNLDHLTSIDKDVAKELAKFEGGHLSHRLTSIDKDVAQELANFKGKCLSLCRLTSIDKDVAKELGKFEVQRNMAVPFPCSLKNL